MSLKKTFMTLGFLVAFTGFCFAASLDDLKLSGQIGERPNGLLGSVVSAPSPEVHAIINQINTERLSKYRGVAEKNGLPLEQVQKLAGEKLINQSPKGFYIQDQSGQWVQK